MHLIEVLDQPWLPYFHREAVTDALALLLGFAELYSPIVPRLAEAIRLSGTRQVVDLCSGAGGPWSWLLGALENQEDLRVDLYLTDKFPNPGASSRAADSAQIRVHHYPDPVDVRRIPAQLKGFRTLFTSFHHFRPQEARTILRDAADNRQGIGIFEVAGRDPITLLSLLVIPILTLLLVPFIRPFRWQHLIWTYLVPVVPCVLLFDGLVSCLRSYSLPELADLTKAIPLSGYTWEIGKVRTWPLALPVTYLIGHPASRRP
jgi:hypothetical protein